MPPIPAVPWGVIGSSGQNGGSSANDSKKADSKKAAGGTTIQAGDRFVSPSGRGPVALFFCSERLGETAGLGGVALRAKFKQGIKPLQDTIFDNGAVLVAFKKAGINEYFKITATKENQELAKKYKVLQDNTLVICAPSGDAIITLAGAQCHPTVVLKLLKTWPEVYDAWKKKNNAQ